MNQYERSNDVSGPGGGGTPGESGPAGGTTPTRDALLGAARTVFARRGYDGASIRAITREAGANLGSVTYHFGSKQNLYEDVLRSVLAPLAERVSAVAEEEPAASLERVTGIVRTFFRHLELNPDLPHLMLQELAAGKAPPPPVNAFLGSVVTSLARVVGEGQREGEIRAGDPVLLGVSCVIQPIHFTLVGRWLGALRGVDGTEDDARAGLVEHAVAFARSGLAAEGAS